MPRSHKPIVVVLFWSLGKISKCRPGWQSFEQLDFGAATGKTLDNSTEREEKDGVREKENDRKRERGKSCAFFFFFFSFPIFWVTGRGAARRDLRYYCPEAWQLDKASLHLEASQEGAGHSQALAHEWTSTDRHAVMQYRHTHHTHTHTLHTYRHAQECVFVSEVCVEQRSRRAGVDARDLQSSRVPIGTSLSSCYPPSDTRSGRGRESPGEEEREKRRTSGSRCSLRCSPVSQPMQEMKK